MRLSSDQLNALISKQGYALEDSAPAAVRIEQPSIKQIVTQFEIQPSTDEKKLNKTEKAFLRDLRSGGYQWIGVQAVTLKLGDDCRYTPDFAAISGDGAFVFFEVKGFMRDDALVKLKTAARAFPWAMFILVKRKGGAWEETRIKN